MLANGSYTRGLPWNVVGISGDILLDKTGFSLSQQASNTTEFLLRGVTLCLLSFLIAEIFVFEPV